MKDKRRSLKTKFWDDNFISELSPSHKLLYIYLLTNPLTNLIGIYEISTRRIKFDTGLTDETISKGLELLGKHSKAFFLDSQFMVLPNWLKNQDFNTNMRKGAKAELTLLPKWVSDRVLGNGSEGLLNDSEWLPNGSLTFENIEGEEEVEVEEEIEIEKKKELRDRCQKFVDYCNNNLKQNGRVRSWKVTAPLLKAFGARLKEFEPEQFIKAIEKAKQVQIHKENNYQYLTPEFFTRIEKLNQYGC